MKVVQFVMSKFNEENKLEPTALILNRKGANKIFPIPHFLMDNDRGKDKVHELIVEALVILDPKGFCFTTEAWASTQTVDRPSKDPNRDEIIMLAFEFEDDDNEIMVFKIERHDDGAVSLLLDHERTSKMSHGNTGVGGRFSNFIKDARKARN